MEVAELHSFTGLRVNVWRENPPIAVTAQVAIADIVRHDDDEVGSFRRPYTGNQNRCFQPPTANRRKPCTLEIHVWAEHRKHPSPANARP